MDSNKAIEVIKALGLYKTKYSENNIYESLKSFIAKDLKKLSAELYVLYSKAENFPSKETISRALGKRKGKVDPTVLNKLSELFDKYLEQYKIDLQDRSLSEASNSFLDDVVTTLYRRAMGICSYPDCRKPTFGPDIDTTRAINMGIACRIYEASPDHRRYKHLSKEEMNSIDNAIWLCPFHYSLVNANDGNNFTADEIKFWKKTHEEIIGEWLKGKKSIFFGLMLNNEIEICTSIAVFFSQKDELFTSFTELREETIIQSIGEIKAFLINQKEDVIGTELERIIDSTVRVCKYFLSAIGRSEGTATFFIFFAAMRKAFGLSFAKMEEEYDMRFPEKIKNMISH